MTWDLDDAKGRLSEVIGLALSEGPQTIAGRNGDVVVISSARSEELTGKRPGIKDFLFQGPSLEGLDLEREESPMREVEF